MITFDFTSQDYLERYGDKGDRGEVIEFPMTPQQKAFRSFLRNGGLLSEWLENGPVTKPTGSIALINTLFGDGPSGDFWEGAEYLNQPGIIR